MTSLLGLFRCVTLSQEIVTTVTANRLNGWEIMSREPRKAVAYLRTSSRANVGEDKDSDKRQFAAIEAYTKAAGFEIVATFYDAAVSGADPVTDRPGFAEMLERLMSS